MGEDRERWGGGEGGGTRRIEVGSAYGLSLASERLYGLMAGFYQRGQTRSL